MLSVFFLYFIFASMMLSIEGCRISKKGPDILSLFTMLFGIQVVLPGIILTAAVSFLESSITTGVPFFDKVLNNIEPFQAFLVLSMAMIFIFMLYLSWFFVGAVMSSVVLPEPKYRVNVSLSRWFSLMLLGLVLMWMLLDSLGGGLVGFRNLILFRTGSPEVERTLLNSNIFSLTQTFSLLAVVGLVATWDRKWSFLFIFSVLCLIVFGVMSVSRRAFAQEVLIFYFSFVLKNKKFYFFRMSIIVGSIFPVFVFGKSFLYIVGNNIGLQSIGKIISEADYVSSTIRAFSDVGITTVESWATMLYLDVPFRFGVDHFFSVLRRIPDGLMGLDIAWPERMVRISTKAFVGVDGQDIPPGLMGQMWLDAGILGPIGWGVFFGIQLRVLQYLYNVTVKSAGSFVLFSLVLFVVALPLNSGSYDFVFEFGMIFLLMFVVFVSRFFVVRKG